MRVASFKTFVGLAESLIKPGLTGIVGPNGCGAMAAEPRRQLSVLHGALLLKRQWFGIMTMRRGWKAGVLAIVTVFAFASYAAAKAPSRSKGRVHYKQVMHPRSYIRSLGHGDWRGFTARRAHGHGTGYVALVGDPDSGLGFYPLPIKYRIGAWRYRVRHPRPPWQNPVLFAIAADAVRYNYWVPANQGYRYGVFNPVDGVGTPFFGGYYGHADDDEEPPFPFGRPY